MQRANALGLAIIAVVIGLAALALELARRSDQHAIQAVKERSQAEHRLVESTLAQVRAQRLAGQMGQRTRSIAGLRTAARLDPSAALREEAVATLALPDLEDMELWQPLPRAGSAIVANATLECFATVAEHTNLLIWSGRQPVPRVVVHRPDWRDPSIRLSPDGTKLAAWTSRLLGIWDTAHGRPLFARQVPAGQAIRKVGWAPSSGLIAWTDATDTVRLHDLEADTALAEWGGLSNVWNLALHPVEPWIAVECSHAIEVREWRTGRLLRRLAIDNPGIGPLTWTTDGGRLAIGRFDRTIQVWDIQSDHVVKLEGHTREIVHAWFHPSEDLLASFSWDNTLRLWDTRSGVQVLQASGMTPLGFTADGGRLAVVHQTRGTGFLRLHLPRSYRTLVPPQGQGRSAWTLDFDPASRSLVAATDHGFWATALASGRGLGQGIVAGCRGAHFLEDGRVLSVGAGGLRYWGPPAPDRAPARWTMLGEPEEPRTGARLGLSALDPRAQRIVAHVDDAGLGLIYDLRSHKSLCELRGQPDFSAPAFSPDGRWVASGCWNPQVTKPMFAALWDAATGELLQRFPSTKCSVTFSPDGCHLMLSTAHEYRLLATANWSVERVFERSESLLDNGEAAFAPDGSTVALHATDRTVRLCEPDTGRELARLAAPGQRILKRLRFSPDGRWLAVATEADVQIWDLPHLREELAALGLDWGQDSMLSGSAIQPRPGRPGLLTSAAGPEAGTPWMALLILTGMMLAIGMTLWLRRYQHGILDRYMAVESLTAQRSEELARTQVELAHSQKMRALGTLAAGIAHDFNNLLSVIRMAARLIARRAPQDAEIVENTREIEQAVQQGKDVVRSMLGYSREAHDPPQPFSLPELVEDTVGMLSKEFLSGIALTLELDRGVPGVWAARSRVEQALLNLVVNAAEAMNGRGHLTIAVTLARSLPANLLLAPRSAPGFVELRVADSGPGIDPATLPRIFEPFFTTKTAGAARGTGLGLALVYTVARDEGLGLDVASQSGIGAQFRLFLSTVPPVREKRTDPPAPPR